MTVHMYPMTCDRSHGTHDMLKLYMEDIKVEGTKRQKIGDT